MQAARPARCVVAAIIAADGKAVAVGGDVSEAADAQGIVNAAIETFGRLDVLVNNSGIYEFSLIEENHRRTLPQTVQYQRISVRSPRRPCERPSRRGSEHHQCQFGRHQRYDAASAVYSARKARSMRTPACSRVNSGRGKFAFELNQSRA